MRLVWLALLFLLSQPSYAQSCRDLESLIVGMTPGIDTIVVRSYGGYLPGNRVISVDATGRVMLLDYTRPPAMNRSADVDPSIFDELAAEIESAVEILRSRGNWPRSASEAERRQARSEGRLEPYCTSLNDGLDTDVSIRIGAETQNYRCVTGELETFAHRLLALASEAVALSERMYCP